MHRDVVYLMGGCCACRHCLLLARRVVSHEDPFIVDDGDDQAAVGTVTATIEPATVFHRGRERPIEDRDALVGKSITFIHCR